MEAESSAKKVMPHVMSKNANVGLLFLNETLLLGVLTIRTQKVESTMAAMSENEAKNKKEKTTTGHGVNMVINNGFVTSTINLKKFPIHSKHKTVRAILERPFDVVLCLRLQ